MADPLNPLAYGGFRQNSHLVPYNADSTVAERRSVSTVVVVVLIISSISKKQWTLRNVTSVQTINQVTYGVPRGNIDFVINPNEQLPPIGPMDEVYIFTTDDDGIIAKAATNVGLDKKYIATQNRLFSGLITKGPFRKFDRGAGKTFSLEIATDMFKFDTTSEMKPLINLASVGYGVPQRSSNPISITQAMSQQFLAPPGTIVKGACIESNVHWAYIFNPTINSPDQYADYSPNGNANAVAQAQYHEDRNFSSVVFPDGIRHDQYNIATEFNLSMFGTINSAQFDFNPLTYQYQLWSNRLAEVAEASFCEMFFSRFGQFYFRQLGMFLPAGKWDYVIDPSLILEYQDWEQTDDIVTEIEIRVDTSQTGSPFGAYVFAAPNMRQLETLYGRRYREVEVPSAYWDIASNGLRNPVFSQSPTQVMDYLKAYATLYMGRNNASNIQGMAEILGWTEYEVGSTVYFPHSDRAFYVVSVKHMIEIGKGWTTVLQLSYGRPKDADFYNYINQRAIVLGVDVSNNTTVTSTTYTANGVTTTNQTPPASNFDSTFPDHNPKFNPLGSVIPGIGYDYNVVEKAENGPVTEPIHTGVDLDAPDGTPLISVIHGDVIYSSLQLSGTQNEGWGFYLIIHADPSAYPDTPDFNVAYAHMNSQPTVHVGDTVVPGTPVGNVGHSGWVSGPHVHFEVFQAGTGNNDWIPPYLIPTTANPWKLITNNSTPPSTFSNTNPDQGPVDNLIWQPKTDRHPNGAWKDPNFKTNVAVWATSIANSLGGPKEYYMAVAALECNWGRDINPRWNYGNVRNTDANPNSGDDYNTLSDSAAGFTKFINNGSKTNTYTPFLGYMRSHTNGFDPYAAAYNMYVVGKYGSDSAAVQSIQSIYTSLTNGQWPGGI